MKKFLAVLFLLLVTGCSTVKPVFDRIAQQMGEAKIRQQVVHMHDHSFRETEAAAYQHTGLSAYQEKPVDGSYLYPDHDMLDDMDAYIRPKQHLKYVEEAWDCDDIAKEWAHLSHLWWVDLSKGNVPIALATFVAYVDIEAGAFDGRSHLSGGHALGLLCDADGVWWFVEPSKLWHVKAQEALFEGNIVTKSIAW